MVLLFLINKITFATDNLAATVHKGYYPTYPTINYGTSPKAALIKRGEYLVKLGDCIACHTTHSGGKPFAGGLPISTPFGTIYTPNITPDKKTGIGSWNIEQFIKVMREGISPQGKYYYPAFPYLYFNKITNDDLIAIKAYLDAIPAVKQENRKNELIFPFNWRFLQLGWRLLFFQFQKSGPYKPDPTKSDAWNRGAYLVRGLGHCAMCHTPSHYFIFKSWILAAPIYKYDLTGAFVQGYYAPNISSTNLAHTPIQDIADVFLKDKLIGGGKVEGPMAEANHDSLKYLTMNDIKAIAVYLKSVKSEIPPQPSHGTGLVAGKKIFDQYCQGCHLTGAGGAPKIADQAAWEPLIKQGLNTLYKNAINGIGGMPAKGTCTTCTNKEIQAAVQYIVSQSKPGVAATLGHTLPVKPMKPLTLEDGKNIYNRYCKACHDGSYKGAPVLGAKEAWKPRIQQGIDVLLVHTIQGYKNMPARGSCSECNDAQIKAAVIYMVQESKTKGDYTLWLNQ